MGNNNSSGEPQSMMMRQFIFDDWNIIVSSNEKNTVIFITNENSDVNVGIIPNTVEKNVYIKLKEKVYKICNMFGYIDYRYNGDGLYIFNFLKNILQMRKPMQKMCLTRKIGQKIVVNNNVNIFDCSASIEIGSEFCSVSINNNNYVSLFRNNNILIFDKNINQHIKNIKEDCIENNKSKYSTNKNTDELNFDEYENLI